MIQVVQTKYWVKWDGEGTAKTTKRLNITRPMAALSAPRWRHADGAYDCERGAVPHNEQEDCEDHGHASHCRLAVCCHPRLVYRDHTDVECKSRSKYNNRLLGIVSMVKHLHVKFHVEMKFHEIS